MRFSGESRVGSPEGPFSLSEGRDEWLWFLSWSGCRWGCWDEGFWRMRRGVPGSVFPVSTNAGVPHLQVLHRSGAKGVVGLESCCQKQSTFFFSKSLLPKGIQRRLEQGCQVWGKLTKHFIWDFGCKGSRLHCFHLLVNSGRVYYRSI